MALLAALGGCASEEDDASTGDDSAAIIGGTPSNDRRVMLLKWSSDEGEHVCSSVLVAPDALLTAAHCADAPRGARFQATVDANVELTRPERYRWLSVARVVQHPEWNAARPQLGHDVAIAFLRAPYTGVAPAEISRWTLPPAWADSSARAGHPVETRPVGYGIARDGANPGASGRRREGRALVRDLQAQVVLLGEGAGQACLNDSGGPAFVQHGGREYIVSVASFMRTRSCTTGNYGTRMDVSYPFLQATLGSRLSAPLESAPLDFPNNR